MFSKVLARLKMCLKVVRILILSKDLRLILEFSVQATDLWSLLSAQ